MRDKQVECTSMKTLANWVQPMTRANMRPAENVADSLRERVYRYLANAIYSGKLRHGEFLNQDAICSELAVSKAPLRDALIRLEAEGFISILPRKGVFVTPVTLDFVRSAYQIMGSIESDCINEVFSLLTDDHIRKFEESNRRQMLYLDKQDFRAYYEENVYFHNIFLSLSANTLIQQILTPLRLRLNDLPHRAYACDWEELNLWDHERFIESLRLGNKEGAMFVFRNEHWSFEAHEPYIRRYYRFNDQPG